MCVCVCMSVSVQYLYAMGSTGLFIQFWMALAMVGYSSCMHKLPSIYCMLDGPRYGRLLTAHACMHMQRLNARFKKSRIFVHARLYVCVTRCTYHQHTGITHEYFCEGQAHRSLSCTGRVSTCTMTRTYGLMCMLTHGAATRHNLPQHLRVYEFVYVRVYACVCVCVQCLSGPFGLGCQAGTQPSRTSEPHHTSHSCQIAPVRSIASVVPLTRK